MFIEAEKQKLTNNLTLNLRCRSQRLLVRQWILRSPSSDVQVSRSSIRKIMLTMEEAMKQSATRFAQGEIVKGTVIELRKNEVLVDIGYKSEGVITGKVTAIVKGGLVVNVGVEAFLPASQIDVTTPKNLASFVGNSYEFKVVKINQERQNIVLSRRELIESERTTKRAKILGEMVPGDIRKGTVKNITD